MAIAIAIAIALALALEEKIVVKNKTRRCYQVRIKATTKANEILPAL